MLQYVGQQRGERQRRGNQDGAEQRVRTSGLSHSSVRTHAPPTRGTSSRWTLELTPRFACKCGKGSCRLLAASFSCIFNPAVLPTYSDVRGKHSPACSQPQGSGQIDQTAGLTMLWSGFRLHRDLLSWEMIVMILTDYINVTHGPRSPYQSIIPSEKLRNNPLSNTLQRGWMGQQAPVAPGGRSELLLDFQVASFTSSLHVSTRLNVVLLGEVPESDQSSSSE